MEDRAVTVRRTIGDRAVTFLGVYDGHGGSDVADLAADELHGRFFEALTGGAEPVDALRHAYAVTARGARDYMHVGSTACTVCLLGLRLVAAWLGDSQFVVVTRNATRFVAPPHRLDDAGERARVAAAGAEFSGVYVVRGDYGLMMTRALGDRWFEPVGISAEPSVATLDLDPGVPSLVVLASDGLWEVVDPENVAALFDRQANNTGFDYARALANAALVGGSRDNVTVVTAIVERPDPSKDE